MTEANATKAAQARDIMMGFAQRTGLTEDASDSSRRYLWTDAFATLNFLALKRQFDAREFEAMALRTIKQVHCHLGQFAADDQREGWISGLTGDNALEHPTVGGLRIGKELLERTPEESYDAELEWQRDGQYYHYHTRWIVALLRASKHFNNEQLALWAAELSLAGARFMSNEVGRGNRLYWKMSIDLSRPLVPMMGAHDPLEGLLCAMQTFAETGTFKYEFDGYIARLKELCASSHWATEDPLGAGSLLLDVVRATELQAFMELPPAVKPQRLMRDAQQSLEVIYENFDTGAPAHARLAFRDCGLSLGLRCLQASVPFIEANGVEVQIEPEIWQLADDIEDFWSDARNQEASSFQNHLDINEVTLASSLLASSQPEIFTRV
ncbi:hypothetical protein [Pseudidiomarina insulisalsae]|uniref:Uncharacterized protein n=1 Tax=Pseudidiomarina insulisalsae TaxID=575789 RepID=A0A432YCJ3_9GAMM|nr:hypothetical protein [Pseudidiomarina insulisalsae]RUO58725.1 hypothetical protein CWI71_09900 [Pseudidiomarina insulisalsae]